MRNTMDFALDNEQGRRGYDASYSAVIGSKMADIEQFISLAKHFRDFSFRLTGLSHNRDFSLRRSGARARNGTTVPQKFAPSS